MSRTLVRGVAAGVAVGMCMAVVGCLTRPVVPEQVVTHRNFTIDANGTSIVTSRRTPS